ncbi:hypothetical protein [Enhydrobacter sp.]|jgi:hypothetical protein|uniref:portal protein n=1 Tax=Enhydrobacter sp. TaxID=1894999 RepID=UPI0026330BFE|nr:hypothetical protein [Enhydrobacter sp.]WIM14498.1 MAG: hypothetical protein OJF58_005468 [Enhydrobacter sp.]
MAKEESLMANDGRRQERRDGQRDGREERLKAALFREEQRARQWQEGELGAVRQASLAFYDRAPRGDEVEGQSRIVTSEYADTVESIMPALMRVFALGEDIVRFTPDNPGDEQAAREASDYIPHLFMRENEGFTWLYWFLKDALMYRLAWGAVDVEDIEEVKRTAVAALPADAWALMQAEIAQRAAMAKAEVAFEVAQDDGPADGPATYSGTITVRRTVRKVRVDNIAPEDGLVSPEARHIDGASFAGYRKQVTASDLRALGLDRATIDNLSSDDLQTTEQAGRQPDVIPPAGERDDSERRLWVVVAFVKFDWDGDGISEMRRVVYAHAGGQVSALIENEEWTDGIAPIVPGSPILMSHTIEGRSLFDQVKDIQEIGTAVARGMLDNMYLVNRPRPAVSDAVDLASLIDWTPGMPIRMRQGQKPSADNLAWVTVPSQMTDALAVLQWKDEIQQKRTGVTPNNQGVPDEAMNPTATGAAIVTSAADARIELIARTLAETSIKRLFRLIYRAVKRAASGEIHYWKGAPASDAAPGTACWARCDPTRWPDDMSLEVDVGLGTGNKHQQLQNLALIAQGQKTLLAAPGGPLAVTLEQCANTFRKMVQAAGFKNTAQFVNEPQQIALAQRQQASAPPPADPAMAAVRLQAEVERVKQQSEARLAREKLAAEIALKRERARLDMQLAREKASLDAELRREQIAAGRQGRP